MTDNSKDTVDVIESSVTDESFILEDNLKTENSTIENEIVSDIETKISSPIISEDTLLTEIRLLIEPVQDLVYKVLSDISNMDDAERSRLSIEVAPLISLLDKLTRFFESSST